MKVSHSDKKNVFIGLKSYNLQKYSLIVERVEKCYVTIVNGTQIVEASLHIVNYRKLSMGYEHFFVDKWRFSSIFAGGRSPI